MESFREEAATKHDLTTGIAALRDEMATKDDLAALGEVLRQELTDSRAENRKEHLTLYATLRKDLRQELASHMGTIQEMVSSQLQQFLEAADLRYVRRDELAELLP